MFQLSGFENMGPLTGSGGEALGALANQGFAGRRQRVNEAYELAVNSAVRLFGDVLAGRVDQIFMREALNPQHDFLIAEIDRRYPGIIRATETMSVTDFPQYLTVDVLDRVLYGYYANNIVPNFALVKKVTLNDMRTVKRFQINGAIEPFPKQLNPGEPPKQRSMTPVAPIEYAPDVYQGMMSINWRALLNDNMGIFNQLTQSLSASWLLTVWTAITELFVDEDGPNALLYNSTFKNLILTANGSSIDNPPLDFQGLQDGLNVLSRMRTPENQPVVHQGQLYLVVGGAQELTAKALLSADKVDISVGALENADGFPLQRFSVDPKYVTANIKLIVDKKMRDVCTDDAVRDKMWFLTYDPEAQPRPSIEFGFVREWDTPQLFQRAPNTMRVGGAVDPMLGDFLTGDLDYKSMVIFGGKQVDGRSTVASTGAGVRT
jgi:hypothetical protein